MCHRLSALTILLCSAILCAPASVLAEGLYTHNPTPDIRLDGQSTTYKSYSWTWDISAEYGDIQSAILKLYFYDDDA